MELERGKVRDQRWNRVLMLFDYIGKHIFHQLHPMQDVKSLPSWMVCCRRDAPCKRFSTSSTVGFKPFLLWSSTTRWWEINSTMMMILLRTFLLFLGRAKNLIESKNERNPKKLRNMFQGFVDNVAVLQGFSFFYFFRMDWGPGGELLEHSNEILKIPVWSSILIKREE